MTAGRDNVPAPGARALRVGLMVHQFPVVSETFVTTLAEELLQSGHDVRILATDPAVPEGPVHDLVTRSGLDRRVSRASGATPLAPGAAARLARISPVHGARALALLAGALLAPGRFAVTRMCLAQDPFDVVHAQFGWSGLTAARHRRWGTLRTRALIVHFRGHDITTFVQDHGEDVYADLFREADAFIANSAHFRDRAVALGCPPEKIRVIGSPIDTDYFAPPRTRAPYRDRPLKLLAVGRLVEKKGFADAISAVRILRDGGMEVCLRIIGDGPLRRELEAQRDREGVGAQVAFAGAGSRAEVRAALHAFDILLAPSVRAASGDEDAAVNTLKEAMATGMPVIGTRHGGIPELVVHGENGLLVPERDPAALAEAVTQLAEAPHGWQSLGAAGRDRVVREFGKSVIMDLISDAYNSAISSEGKAI